MPHNVRAVIARFKGSPWQVAEVVIPDPGPQDVVVVIKACGGEVAFGAGREHVRARREIQISDVLRQHARTTNGHNVIGVQIPGYSGSANQGGPVAVPDDRIDRPTSLSDVVMGGPEPRLEAVQRRGPLWA